jgi:hypothetical protein
MGQNIDQPGFAGSQPQQPQQFDLNAMIAAFLMQQQQQNTDRIGLQRERSFGRNIGWTGPGGLTPQAKWDEMFPNSAASRLTPEALLASQGPSAMNQWAQQGGVKGIDQGQLADQNLQRKRKSTGKTFSFGASAY